MKKVEEIARLIKLDKRKFERLELDVSVYYRYPGEIDWLGPFTASNIGGNGLSIVLAKEIEKHAELELKIFLPQKPERPIEVRGEVIWINPVEGRFNLGIRFLKMQEDDRRIFVAYICDSIMLTYLKEKKSFDKKARFDVVTIDYSNGKPNAQLLKNAFELDESFTV